MSWRFLHKNCQSLSFSQLRTTEFWVYIQELPKFDCSLTKVAQKYTLAQTKFAKKVYPWRDMKYEKYTIVGGISKALGTSTMKEPPPTVPSCQSIIHLFEIRGEKTEVFCYFRFWIFETKILFCVQSLVFTQIFTSISVFVTK